MQPLKTEDATHGCVDMDHIASHFACKFNMSNKIQSPLLKWFFK
jgi:hypothetical protein